MTVQSDLPEGFELLRAGSCVAAVRSCAKDQLLALGILDKSKFEEVRRSGRPAGSGRGQAVSIQLGTTGAERAVVRHCRRGGVFGRLLGGVYFGGARPVEELRVAETARTRGVPAPEYLAAIVRRRGCSYSGDVIVREVPGAVSLEEWLRKDAGSTGPFMRQMAAALADTFTKLVAANIYHPDLHAGNVLVANAGGDIRALVIDFDKARQAVALTPRLRNKMLFRFNRALVKRHLAPRPVGLLTRVRFCKQLGMTSSRDEMKRLISDCGAHLRRHAWRYRKH